MKQAAFLAIFAAVVLTVIYTVLTVYDNTMKLGRMRETPGVRPHEEPLLVMAKGVVPVDGGNAVTLLPGNAPEIPTGEPDLVAFGKNEYRVFCSHCHGKYLDGQGPVGQSFSPLAMDLRDPVMIARDDADLWNSVSAGKNRMPGLASSMSKESRIAVIAYIRSEQQAVQ